MTCKEWYIPANYFLPLCGNLFQPRTDNKSCPVCVAPANAPASGSGGSGSGETLSVEPP